MLSDKDNILVILPGVITKHVETTLLPNGQFRT